MGFPRGPFLAQFSFQFISSLCAQFFKKHGISHLCYADNSRIYLPLKHKSVSPLKGLLDCLEDVKAWMALNVLSLNEQKTKIIVFGPCDHYDFGPLGIYFERALGRNLGVSFDSNLTFDKHINAVIKTSFFHLQLLAK